MLAGLVLVSSCEKEEETIVLPLKIETPVTKVELAGTNWKNAISALSFSATEGVETKTFVESSSYFYYTIDNDNVMTIITYKSIDFGTTTLKSDTQIVSVSISNDTLYYNKHFKAIKQ